MQIVSTSRMWSVWTVKTNFTHVYQLHFVKFSILMRSLYLRPHLCICLSKTTYNSLQK